MELKVQLNFKNTRDAREMRAAVLEGADPLLNDATFLLKASNDSCYQEQSIWTAAGLAHKFED